MKIIISILCLFSISAAFAKNEKLRAVHEALFEAYVPQELTLHPQSKEWLDQGREDLWKEIIRVPEIKLAYGLFTNLEFLTGSLGSHFYYSVFKQNSKRPSGREIKNASRVLKSFLRSTGEKRFPFTSLADLSLQNRRQLLSLFEQSELNWHRRLPLTLKAFYLGGIFRGRMGVEIAQLPEKNDPGRQELPDLDPLQNLSFTTHLKYNVHEQHLEGEVDYIVVGSGTAGSIIAAELHKAGKKVVVLEKGPFVHPTLYNARNNMHFLRNNGIMPNAIGDIIIGSSEVAGGGSTVNFDMAFPVTHPSVLNHFREWKDLGIAPSPLWTEENLIKASQTITDIIKIRDVSDEEINSNNRVLMEGALAHNRIPSKVKLATLTKEEMQKEENQQRATDKNSSLEKYLLPSVENKLGQGLHPVTLLVNSRVEKVMFEGNKARGVKFQVHKSLNLPGISNDLYKFNFPEKVSISLKSKHVILAAGAIGSSFILINSGIKNRNIGRGPIIHPVIPMVAMHDKVMDHFEGTQSSIYIGDALTTDYKNPKDNYVIETSIYPVNKAAMSIPGTPEETLSYLKQYRHLTGAGVILIDSVNENNYLKFKKKKDDVTIQYRIAPEDKKRFVKGLGEAARILFKGGAKEVLLNTSEKYLGQPGLQVMRSLKDVDIMEKNLKLKDASTLMLSGHIMSTNKMGTHPATSVVDLKHKVWNYEGLYVCDAGVFPTSVGANPMMSIYTISYLFARSLTMQDL
jgi:choline dehydrogenase-like flavoprotein